jgi:hypothetical protein
VLAIRERTKNVVAELGTSWAPIAGIVGVSIGVIAGVLTLLARWKPRLAVGVAIALMLFVASGVANQWIFGAGADFVLDWRQRQHKWRSIPRISDLEIASAVGGTAGGFAGVTTAGLVLWNSRNKRRRAMQA